MQVVLSALLLSLIATFCFGTATFLSSKAAKDLGALQALFLFQLLGMPAFLFLFPFAPSHVHIQLTPLVLLGIFQTFCMLLWFYALKIGNVSIVSPVSEVYSLISVLLGIVFLHESVGVLRFAGIGFIFFGVLLLGVELGKFRTTRPISLYKGIVPALIYAVGLAVFFFFSALSARQNGWFVSAMGIRFTIVVTSFLLLLQQGKNFKTIFKKVPWIWITVAGLIDAVGFALFSLALTNAAVSYVTVFVSAQSVITVILAYFFFKEKLQFYQLVGLAGVVVGLIFIQFH